MKKLPDNQITFYQSNDGSVNIEVLYAEESIWLTQKKMAELFACSVDNISLHLKNIYLDNEANELSTTEDFSIVQNSVVNDFLTTKHIEFDVFKIVSTCKDFLQVQSESNGDIYRTGKEEKKP